MTSAPQPQPSFSEGLHKAWLARFAHVDTDPVEATLVIVVSDTQPAGSIVDMPLVGPGLGRADLRLAQIRFVPSSKVIRRIQVFAPVAPGAPGMVYTDALDTAGQFAAATLVAFERPAEPGPGSPWEGVAEGALLDGATFAALGLTEADQVGAVQWWPHNGQITQLYVSPLWRRRKVASKIVVAAELVSRSRGGQRVRGGGERTQLGEAFTSGAPSFWTHRVADLTTVRPPMTPDADTDGVPERNLEVRP
jgi:GNAT superfamily N-acetyltransferase